MRMHRLARFVAVLLFVAALIYFSGGVAIAAILWSRGLGAGWGTGFTGWIAIPILVSALFGALMLLMVGVILYFLARIDMNLSLARENAERRAAQPLPATTQPSFAELPIVIPEAEPLPDEPIRVAPSAYMKTPTIGAGTAISAGVTAAVGAGKLALETPEVTTDPPTLEITAPVADVVEPAVEPPIIEIAAPEVTVVSPAVEPPTLKITAPEVAVVAPAVEMIKPEVEIGALEPPSTAVEPTEEAVRASRPAQPQLSTLETFLVGVGRLALGDEPAEPSKPKAGAPAAAEPVQPDLQAELPQITDETAPEKFTGRLPGANEIARIASEMAAIQNPRNP